MKRRSKILSILLELMIVFVGVFAAFWLNDYQNRKIEEKNKEQIYQIVYDELNRFYIAGTEKKEFENFTDLLMESELYLDSLVTLQQIPSAYRISGDYWRLDVVHAMYDSGKLADIDPSIFKKLSTLKSNHTIFIEYIQEFNSFYLNNITLNSDLPTNHFYNNEGALKEKYRPAIGYLKAINGYPEILTNWAFEIKEEIKRTYLK